MEVRVTPNPFVRRTSISLELPAPGSAAVRIMDIGGRVVRDFGVPELPEGRGVLSWDARDGSGHRVASGVYYIQVLRQDGSHQRSVIVL
jgi:flagellar hook assembly protein FlgD